MKKFLRHNPLIILISILSFTAITLFSLIAATQTRQEIRTPAATSSGTTYLTLEPQTATIPVDQQLFINVYINTKDIQAGQAEFLIYLQGNAGIQVETLQIADFITSVKFIDNALSFHIVPKDSSIPLVNNQDTKVAIIRITPTTSGQFNLVFDQTLSKITEFNSTKDILFTPTDGHYTIEGECDAPAAPAKIKAEPGQNSGEIIVSWTETENTDHYALAYGPQSHNYIWGQTNIGSYRGYTIKGLEPGTRYYIVISSVNSCGASQYSVEASAISSGQKASGPTITYPTATTVTLTPDQLLYGQKGQPDQSSTPSAQTTPASTPSATESGTEASPSPQPSATPQPQASKLPFPLWLIIPIGALLALSVIFVLSKEIKKTPPPPPSTPKTQGPHHGSPSDQKTQDFAQRLEEIKQQSVPTSQTPPQEPPPTDTAPGDTTPEP